MIWCSSFASTFPILSYILALKTCLNAAGHKYTSRKALFLWFEYLRRELLVYNFKLLITTSRNGLLWQWITDFCSIAITKRASATIEGHITWSFFYLDTSSVAINDDEGLILTFVSWYEEIFILGLLYLSRFPIHLLVLHPKLLMEEGLCSSFPSFWTSFNGAAKSACQMNNWAFLCFHIKQVALFVESTMHGFIVDLKLGVRQSFSFRLQVQSFLTWQSLYVLVVQTLSAKSGTSRKNIKQGWPSLLLRDFQPSWN